MENIKQALFSNWHFMRWLRLGFGIFIAVQAVQSHDAIFGLIASFFLFQAVTNTGCCGAGGCNIPETSRNTPIQNEIESEELKHE